MSTGPERVEAYLDGSLAPDEERRLAEWLAADPDHLRYFVRETHLHSELRDLLLARGSVCAPAPAGLEAYPDDGATRAWFDRVLAWWSRLPVPASAMAVGLAALATLLWWINPDPATRGSQEIGRVMSIVGIPLLHANGRGPVELTNAAPIHLGDRLETGDADKAEIRFLDGTTLRLAFNTVVELPMVGPTEPTDTNALQRPPDVRLLQGQVWTQVQKTTNAPTYAIRTDAATAIARGTEFGVKLQRLGGLATNSPFALRPSPFASVLTVKEGLVDFTNAFGSVQATAMTESTARADSAPTEPRRLETLQVVSLGGSMTSWLISSPLDATEAAERLVGGGGWAGLLARDFEVAASNTAPTPKGTRLGPTRQVRIARVMSGSPAAEVGLRPGDILQSLDTQPVVTAAQLHREVLLRADTATTLTVIRDGREAVVTLEPVRKLGGALRRGVLVVAKAARPEHPQSGL